MSGFHTGVGISLGAGLGILLGLLLLSEWWWGPLVGAAVGLIVGAVIDNAQSTHTQRHG